MDYSPIFSGKKWSNSNVSYSFMTSVEATYPTNPDYGGSFEPVSNQMRATISAILSPSGASNPLRPAYFSDVSQLTFSQVQGTGNIAIGSFDQPPPVAASAYLPGPDYGGDVWLGSNFTTPAALGSFNIMLSCMSSAIL
jgi:hypothetical protein